MSLYEREYMRVPREGVKRGGDFLRQNSAVKVLIIANIVCFVMGFLFDALFGRGTFFQIFELSKGALMSGKVWTLITYSFLHADFFHILLNMVGLFFIGSPLEKMIGKKKFFITYFLGALIGGLIWLAFSWNMREGLVGASAAVMSVFACFCAFYPPMPLTFLIFFVIPVSMRPMTMLKIAAAFELVGLIASLSGSSSVIAYSAHLGGMGTGLLAAYIFKRGGFSGSIMDFFKRSSPVNLGGAKSASDYKFSVNIGGRAQTQQRVDEILDKINSGGFSSLTDEEKDFLRRAREQLK